MMMTDLIFAKISPDAFTSLIEIKG